ncbi:MAG TPA: carboxypeptidase regulatory-like domain-containing protein [Candidatus Kapabacteria bacterium]|nr:carboxypeptidase regulatory-like domain-containing protein [Candidatus Kapabacteria bacterium]
MGKKRERHTLVNYYGGSVAMSQRIISFFIIFSCSVTAAFSQDAIISGKITDGSTGDIMRSVTVELLTKDKQSTKKGAYSDVTGKYTIKKVQQGVYSLRFRYVGYETKLIENVEVPIGKNVTVNVTLSPETKKAEEVVVTARANKESKEAILAQRKNSAQVSDGVGQEEIAKLPDGDAGQALKRITGVTVVGDKFVYVRGVSERYNNTTLNGAALTSTEPDKKAFAFDMFPSEFLQSANVIKSFTPDMPGNFAGGLVQLNTIDFPQGFAFKVGLSSAYNDNVSLKSGAFQTYSGGATDWLASDDGTRALVSGMPSTSTELDNLIRRAGNPEADNGAAAREWIALGRSFNSGVWKQDAIAAPVNTGTSISYSNLFDIADNDFGIIASANYSNGYNINQIGRAGLSGAGNEQYNYAGSVSTRSMGWGGLFNMAYKLGGHSTLSFKNIYNQSADDEVVVLQGNDYNQDRERRFYSAQFVEKSLYSGQVAGQHNLPGDILTEWNGGFSRSTRNEPDLRRLRYSRQNDNELFSADVPSETAKGDGTVAGRFFSDLIDNAYTAGLNITIPVSTAKIKTGALLERRDREFGARSFTIIQSKSIFPDVDPEGINLTASPDKLFDSTNFRANGLGIAEDSKKSDQYAADEQLNAGYAMVDMPFSIGDENFRIITGVRVENNTQRLPAVYTGDNQLISIERNTTDILPALNLIWKTSENTNVRVSGSQTLTRPNLREFAPFAFFDFQRQARVQGNTDLQRALIWNFDARYEYFPRPGEVLSVSTFYKSFQNAIEETILPSSGNPVFSFQNASGTALNYGIEFELRKQLGFIAEDLENLGASVNVSLINSEVNVRQGNLNDTRPMWGQSPYSINLGLFYQHPDIGTQVNVGYNRSGERIIQVGLLGSYDFANPHVYEQPRDVVDISLSQPIIAGLEARLVVRDVLNQELIWLQGGRNVASNLRGRTLNFSIGFKL